MAKLEIVRKRLFKGDPEAIIVGLEIHDNGLIVKGSAYVPIEMEYANIFCPGVGINHFQAKHYIKRILPKDMGVAILTYPGHIPTRGEYDPERNVEYTSLLVDNIPEIFLTDKIIISGHSGGGRDALGVVAIRNDIKGLVLISPAYNIFGAMTREWRYRVSSKIPKLTGPIVKMFVNRGWRLEDIDNWSTFRVEDFDKVVENVKKAPASGDYAGSISSPVLLFHGTEDERIPIVESQRLRDELEKEDVDVDYVELKGDSHNPFVEQEALKIMRPKLREWQKKIERLEESHLKFPERLIKRISAYKDKQLSSRFKELYG